MTQQSMTDADLQAFRQEVRDFVRTSLAPSIREKVRLGLELSKDEILQWEGQLTSRGWMVPHWPEKWGGTGWGPRQRAVFQEEMVANHAPEVAGISVEMIGPVLIRYGTPAQQQYFLPRIVNLEHWWCQGYSEPNAGSDLASVTTRAERRVGRDGTPVYVVNGSKVWTSYAQHANWIFCLVRTDMQARAQQGISFLLIDMSTPGVTVRPLVGIHGWHLFNQVFFDDVEVPVENLVGEENAGWTIAKSLLEFERLNLARVAENRRRLAKVRAIGRQVMEAGQPLMQRPWFVQRLRELDVRFEALAATVLRFRMQAEAGRKLGAETGMLKLVGSVLIQDIENLAVDAIGPHSVAYERAAHFDPAPSEPGRSAYAPSVSARRFVTRGYTIAGGSSEIQHEVLAKQVLGL